MLTSNGLLSRHWVFIVQSLLHALLSLTYAADLVVKGVLHLISDEIFGYTIVVDALGKFKLCICYSAYLYRVYFRGAGGAFVPSPWIQFAPSPLTKH